MFLAADNTERAYIYINTVICIMFLYVDVDQLKVNLNLNEMCSSYKAIESLIL